MRNNHRKWWDQEKQGKSLKMKKVKRGRLVKWEVEKNVRGWIWKEKKYKKKWKIVIEDGEKSLLNLRVIFFSKFPKITSDTILSNKNFPIILSQKLFVKILSETSFIFQNKSSFNQPNCFNLIQNFSVQNSKQLNYYILFKRKHFQMSKKLPKASPQPSNSKASSTISTSTSTLV